MSEPPPDLKNLHFNLGSEHRSASRDYNEYFIPGSMKLILTTWSQTRLNRTALGNERFFSVRFGFEPPRKVRQQVLDIQKEHGLTDRELRWLRRSGQLVVSRTEAKLAPSRLMVVSGWLQMITLIFACAAMALQIGVSHEPAWKQVLGQVIVSGLLFAGVSMLNSWMIGPWRTLKCIGVGAVRS